MTLSHRNWLVRFGFWGADFGIPQQTSLCALFWRIVWRAVLCGCLLTLVGFYGYSWIYFTWSTLLQTLGVIALVAAMLLIVLAPDLWKAARKHHETTVVGEALYGIKHRMCPIIHISEDV